MSTIVKADANGTVTLPADLCRAAGVEPGGDLVVKVEGGRVVLGPARPTLAERIAALTADAPPKSLTNSLLTVRRSMTTTCTARRNGPSEPRYRPVSCSPTPFIGSPCLTRGTPSTLRPWRTAALSARLGMLRPTSCSPRC